MDGGYSSTYGYSVEPDLKYRIGEFAQSELTLTQGSIFILQPIGPSAVSTPLPLFETAPGNTSSTAVAERLSSGPEFTVAKWNVAAEDTETYGSYRYSDRLGSAELDYQLNRSLGIIATGGYEDFSSPGPQSSNLDGPIAKLGFRLTSNETFELTFEGGLQYGSQTFTGDLNYEIDPSLVVSGSVTDSVQTPTQRLLENLQNYGSTPNSSVGTLSNTANSLAGFSPLPLDQLLINNTLGRYRTATLSGSYKSERTTFQLTAFGTLETNVGTDLSGFDNRSTSFGGRIAASRNLSRETSANFDADYTVQREIGVTNHLFDAELSWQYMLSQVTTLSARANYIDRQTSGIGEAELFALDPNGIGNLQDVEFTLTLHHKF